MTTSSRRARSAKVGAPKPSAISAEVSPLDHAALLNAMQTLMQPLAELSVARGLSLATVEELLKRAFVDAAGKALASGTGARRVSRISTVTGLNRREVARLMQARTEMTPARYSPATQVFTRWIAEPSLKNARGEPMPLRRQGPAPSFEQLAKSVTRDVHPRSLLDELCRLGLARVDGELVRVVRKSFVPNADRDRMFDLMGSNVGDHFRAAVANVQASVPAHLEQAVFADELSQASIDEFQSVVRAQWQALLTATVPTLHGLIAADQAAKRPQDRRVRVGMYAYSEAMADIKGRSDLLPPKRSPKPATKARKRR